MIESRATLNDGSVALTLEPDGWTVRILDHVPADHMPPYIGAGRLSRISDSVCKLAGFHGTITRGHVVLIARALVSLGFDTAYIERAGMRRIPGAKKIEDGDFAGWWRVDLPGFVANVDRRAT